MVISISIVKHHYRHLNPANNDMLIGIFPREDMAIQTNSGNNKTPPTTVSESPSKSDSVIKATQETNGIHPIGTAGIVVQLQGPNETQNNAPYYTITVTGVCRIKLGRITQEHPYLMAEVYTMNLRFGPTRDQASKKNQKLTLFGLTNIGKEGPEKEIDEHLADLKELAWQLMEIICPESATLNDIRILIQSIPAENLSDICASIVQASHAERLAVLDADNIKDRIKKTMLLLARQIENLKVLKNHRKSIRGSSDDDVEEDADDSLWKDVNRSQSDFHNRSINNNRLNDPDSDPFLDNADMDENITLERRLRLANLPENVSKITNQELLKLRRMPNHMPEYAMMRSYLELISDLPWNKSTREQIDLAKSRRDLDNDHYGLDKLKERVLQYLAVRKLKNSSISTQPILFFVGPPGTGKTSIARSISKSLGRKFQRISLGGVSDQSSIRGHRRTYIGSMPGRIIQGLNRAGTNNPVFLLDEVDKMNKGVHGDPAAALLEVLDPEQNHSFIDHYLNVPFDLSNVMFIATANSLADISPALLDRMEIIQVPGYTHDEKYQIAIKHLIPKQISENGLTEAMIQFREDAIHTLISQYAREAGVRNLERKIASVCRVVAVKVLEMMANTTDIALAQQFKQLDQQMNSVQEMPATTTDSTSNDLTLVALTPSDKNVVQRRDNVASRNQLIASLSGLPVIVDSKTLIELIGPPVYDNESNARKGVPGVAVGMAWTSAGGEIMYVETEIMEGSSKESLVLTGQLGSVMRESAKLALNWIRANFQNYPQQLPNTLGKDLVNNTVHIHFPAGAVGKDGPSAGVTIVVALMSLFSNISVSPDLAMTGEITLRGLVLKVGGVKSKVLAAHRAGIKKILLPKKNESDLDELPLEIRNSIKFSFVNNLDEVIQLAFDNRLTKVPKTTNQTNHGQTTTQASRITSKL